jgi:signal transduction histidine kinase
MDSPMKLLVVEGLKRTPRQFWENLETKGYVVSSQQNASECLPILAAENECAVLVDVDYTKSGVDAIGEIRGAAPQALILALGSQEKLVALDKALEQGASDFLIKHPDLSHFEEIPYAIARAKAAVALRRETEELKKRLGGDNKAVSDYILHVTQDLKGPLAAMMGYIEIAASLIPEGAPANQALSLQRIEALARHLLELITNHTNAIEIQSGKVEMHKVTQPIKQALELAVHDRKATAGAKNVEIVLQAPDNLPPVTIDVFQIERAVGNIITNAISLSPAGSQVTVTAEAKDRELRVIVKDNGAGITEAERPNLFDRTKTLRRRGGDIDTVGLYVAERVVKLHGGRIDMESDALEGNALILCLPIAE